MMKALQQRRRFVRRRVAMGRGPPARGAKRPSKRGTTGTSLFILALIAGSVWLLWPTPAKVAAVAPLSPPAIARPPRLPAPPRPRVARATAPAAAPKKTALATVPPVGLPARERLLQAVQARTPDLASCALPPRAPAVLPTSLRVAKEGQVRSLRFAVSDPLPEALATCLREKMLAWRFADLELKRDVELVVSFRLGQD
jgi:hypothetical protein